MRESVSWQFQRYSHKDPTFPKGKTIKAKSQNRRGLKPGSLLLRYPHYSGCEVGLMPWHKSSGQTNADGRFLA